MHQTKLFFFFIKVRLYYKDNLYRQQLFSQCASYFMHKFSFTSRNSLRDDKTRKSGTMYTSSKSMYYGKIMGNSKHLRLKFLHQQLTYFKPMFHLWKTRWMVFTSKMREKHLWRSDILRKDTGNRPASLLKMSLFHRSFHTFCQ